jgi:hypothetical protein
MPGGISPSTISRVLPQIRMFDMTGLAAKASA